MTFSDQDPLVQFLKLAEVFYNLPEEQRPALIQVLNEKLPNLNISDFLEKYEQ